jgi:hypothetical protein
MKGPIMGLANTARNGSTPDNAKKGRSGKMSQKPMKAHKVPVNLNKPANAPKAKQ